jgi:hypothetical protein
VESLTWHAKRNKKFSTVSVWALSIGLLTPGSCLTTGTGPKEVDGCIIATFFL